MQHPRLHAAPLRPDCRAARHLNDHVTSRLFSSLCTLATCLLLLVLSASASSIIGLHNSACGGDNEYLTAEYAVACCVSHAANKHPHKLAAWAL